MPREQPSRSVLDDGPRLFKSATLGPLGVAALVGGLLVGGGVLTVLGRLVGLPVFVSAPCGAAMVLGAVVLADRRHYRKIPGGYSRWSDPEHVRRLCDELQSQGFDVTFDPGPADEGPSIQMTAGTRRAVLRALEGL